MPITKPRFSELSVTQLQGKMDELGKMVDTARAPDGSVDADALRAKIAAKNDPALASAFERVEHDYRRKVGERLSGGDSPSMVPVHGRPHSLAAGEVQSVMSALIGARAAIARADGDGDGQIDRGEALRAQDGGNETSAAGIANATVIGSQPAFTAALTDWLAQSSRSTYEMRSRNAIHAAVAHAVDGKVESAEGQLAALWFLRDALVSGRVDDRDGVNSILRKADDSFWTRLFGKAGKHLDNSEIAGLVGTSDLAGYAAATEARLEKDLGMPFLQAWLDGGDIADPAASSGPGYHFVPPGS